MNLFKIIAWLEGRRLRTHIVILILALTLIAIWVGLNPSLVNSEFKVSLSMDDTDFQLQKILSMESSIKLMSLWGKIIAFAAIGYIMMTVIPFRSDREWQQGQFQMMRMSQWTTFQIQGVRLLLYFGISWLFFTLLSILAVIGIQVENIDYPGHGGDLFWGTQVLIMTICPIVLSISQVIDALHTAYFQRGNKLPITVLQFLGWISLASIATRALLFVEGLIFPPITLESFGVLHAAFEIPIDLHLEWIAVSILFSGLMTLASGQVLKEVEA